MADAAIGLSGEAEEYLGRKPEQREERMLDDDGVEYVVFVADGNPTGKPILSALWDSWPEAESRPHP